MKRTSKRVLAVVLSLVMLLSITAIGMSAVSAATSLAAPTNIRIQNSGTGFSITWNKAAGAARYKVYYKTADSDWAYVDTNTNSVNIADLEYGTMYYVQVQSIGSNGANGKFTKATSMTHVRTTKLVSTAYNSNATVTVGWNPADGANGYAVAKLKAGEKKYTYFYTADTTFTDTNVIGGTIYYYQIRPYYTNGKSAAYGPWSNTKSLTTLYRPTVTNVNSTVENMNINWNRINGAKSYQLAFKRATDTAWNYRTTTSTYYNVKYPTQEATYYIQVRPINGNYAGSWSEVGSHEIEKLEVPAITGIESTYDNMTVNWSEVENATAYKIAYKRTTDTAWNYRTTTDLSYNIANPTQGATYTVKVSALCGTVSGEYSETSEKEIPVLGTPVITSIKATIYQLSINWDNVADATGYQVAFKRSTDKAWNFRTTTSPTYVVPNPTKGATYYIQVRSLYGSAVSNYTRVNIQVIPENDPYEGLTYHEAGETITVYHPAETELVWVVDEPAHKETITEIKSVYHYRICQGCGQVQDGWTAAQILEHDTLHGDGPGTTVRNVPKPKSGYVAEPVDTVLNISEKGHHEVHVITEAWKEQVEIEESGWYKTVEHAAETVQAKVIDKAAYFYGEPIYETKYADLCWGCDADITPLIASGESGNHAMAHHLKGEMSGYRTVQLLVRTGTKKIEIPEQARYETVTIKEAWSEIVLVESTE